MYNGYQKKSRYLSERGLEWSESYNSSEHPKEPKGGFQVRA